MLSTVCDACRSVPPRAAAILTSLVALVALGVGGMVVSAVSQSLADPPRCDAAPLRDLVDWLRHLDVLDRAGVERELRAAVLALLVVLLLLRVRMPGELGRRVVACAALLVLQVAVWVSRPLCDGGDRTDLFPFYAQRAVLLTPLYATPETRLVLDAACVLGVYCGTCLFKCARVNTALRALGVFFATAAAAYVLVLRRDTPVALASSFFALWMTDPSRPVPAAVKPCESRVRTHTLDDEELPTDTQMANDPADDDEDDDGTHVRMGTSALPSGRDADEEDHGTRIHTADGV